MTFRYYIFLILGFAITGSGVYAQPAIPVQPNMDSLAIEAAKVKEENKKRAAHTQFQYFVIKAESNTYGYDVYADGTLYLHQPTVPASAGLNGFVDTTSAGIVARYAIQKIREGEVPPTISVEELKKLGVLPAK